MGMEHFFQVLEERCIPNHEVRQKEAVMSVLYTVAYSWQERVGDVDFTAFPGQSCGALIVNNPQRGATNKMAAQIANNYLNNLLHSLSIYTHYLNFNAQFSGSRPVFVTDETIRQFEILKETVT